MVLRVRPRRNLPQPAHQSPAAGKQERESWCFRSARCDALRRPISNAAQDRKAIGQQQQPASTLQVQMHQAESSAELRAAAHLRAASFYHYPLDRSEFAARVGVFFQPPPSCHIRHHIQAVSLISGCHCYHSKMLDIYMLTKKALCQNPNFSQCDF